jgi:hypothetical protein
MTIAAACESCGMPLARAEDHALSDPTIPYCIYCAPEGVLPSAAETLDRLAQFMISQDGIEPAIAREKARAYMKTMPAWRNVDI